MWGGVLECGSEGGGGEGEGRWTEGMCVCMEEPN